MDIHNPGPDTDNNLPDIPKGEDLGLIQSTVTPDTIMTLWEWFEYIGKLIKQQNP